MTTNDDQLRGLSSKALADYAYGEEEAGMDRLAMERLSQIVHAQDAQTEQKTDIFGDGKKPVNVTALRVALQGYHDAKPVKFTPRSAQRHNAAAHSNQGADGAASTTPDVEATLNPTLAKGPSHLSASANDNRVPPAAGIISQAPEPSPSATSSAHSATSATLRTNTASSTGGKRGTYIGGPDNSASYPTSASNSSSNSAAQRSQTATASATSGQSTAFGSNVSQGSASSSNYNQIGLRSKSSLGSYHHVPVDYQEQFAHDVEHTQERKAQALAEEQAPAVVKQDPAFKDFITPQQVAQNLNAHRQGSTLRTEPATATVANRAQVHTAAPQAASAASTAAGMAPNARSGSTAASAANQIYKGVAPGYNYSNRDMVESVQGSSEHTVVFTQNSSLVNQARYVPSESISRQSSSTIITSSEAASSSSLASPKRESNASIDVPGNDKSMDLNDTVQSPSESDFDVNSSTAITSATSGQKAYAAQRAAHMQWPRSAKKNAGESDSATTAESNAAYSYTNRMSRSNARSAVAPQIGRQAPRANTTLNAVSFGPAAAQEAPRAGQYISAVNPYEQTQIEASRQANESYGLQSNTGFGALTHEYDAHRNAGSTVRRSAKQRSHQDIAGYAVQNDYGFSSPASRSNGAFKTSDTNVLRDASAMGDKLVQRSVSTYERIPAQSTATCIVRSKPAFVSEKAAIFVTASGNKTIVGIESSKPVEALKTAESGQETTLESQATAEALEENTIAAEAAAAAQAAESAADASTDADSSAESTDSAEAQAQDADTTSEQHDNAEQSEGESSDVEVVEAEVVESKADGGVRTAIVRDPSYELKYAKVAAAAAAEVAASATVVTGVMPRVVEENKTDDKVRIVRSSASPFTPSLEGKLAAAHGNVFAEQEFKGSVIGNTPAEFMKAKPSSNKGMAESENKAVEAKTNTDHIDNEVLIGNSSTRIVTSSQRLKQSFARSAKIQEEIVAEKRKQEEQEEKVDTPSTVISVHDFMHKVELTAAQAMAAAQASANAYAMLEADKEVTEVNAGKNYGFAETSLILPKSGQEALQQGEEHTPDYAKIPIQIHAEPKRRAAPAATAAAPAAAPAAQPAAAPVAAAPAQAAPVAAAPASEAVSAPVEQQAAQAPVAQAQPETPVQQAAPAAAAVEQKVEPVAEVKEEPKAVEAPKAEVKTEPKVEAKQEAKVEAKPETKAEPAADTLEIKVKRQNKNQKHDNKSKDKQAQAQKQAQQPKSETKAQEPKPQVAKAEESKAAATVVENKADQVKSEAVEAKTEQPAKVEEVKAESKTVEVKEEAKAPEAPKVEETKVEPKAEVAKVEETKPAAPVVETKAEPKVEEAKVEEIKPAEPKPAETAKAEVVAEAKAEAKEPEVNTLVYKQDEDVPYQAAVAESSAYADPVKAASAAVREALHAEAEAHSQESMMSESSEALSGSAVDAASAAVPEHNLLEGVSADTDLTSNDEVIDKVVNLGKVSDGPIASKDVVMSALSQGASKDYDIIDEKQVMNNRNRKNKNRNNRRRR